MKFAALSALVAMTITTAACTRGYVTGEALEYNKALAQNMQEEILLNAVRASKRKPMSFASIGVYSGNVKRAFGASPSSLVRTADLGLSINGNLDNSATFNNLNTDKFIGKMQPPISKELLFRFIDQGWPTHLLFAIFVKNAKLDIENYKIWRNLFISKCHEKNTQE